MSKLSLLLIVVLAVAFTTGVFAQRLAIIKPTNPGQTSDAIPIDKKVYHKLLKNELSAKDLKIFENTYKGVIDTISHGATEVIWGIDSGDTNSSYYDPPAGCFIKAVGIVTWAYSPDPISSRFNLLINKPAHPWVYPREKWDGDACYTKDSLGYATLLGPEIWGSGGFPMLTNEDHRVWIEMSYLNFEPDNQREPFIVSVIPYGASGSSMGTDAKDYGTDQMDDSPRVAKFYQAGREGHPKQFVVRHIACTWLIVVEFYENTGPKIALKGNYGSVVTADPRTITIAAIDRDANDATQAGVATAEMFYSINGGAEQKVAMTLASGTNTDGTWSAVLPSGYVNPGDVCALRFEATDKPGLMTALNGGSFRYFSKTADVLFYYNDNSFETADAKDYYWNEPKEWLFDTWDGTTDGAAQIALLDMYDYIVRVDGDYPVNLDNDVFKKWLATGTADKKKYLFWSSQDFLGKENGWVNTTYAADDWHNMYLGISAVSHDLQSAATDVFPPVDPWPVDAVLNDPITGALAKFCADSSFQLLHNPWFEIGGHEFSDHVEPGAGAVTCIRDHASGVSMGVWKDGTSTKTVFLGLDQIALDMNPPYIFPPTYPRYVWPEYGYPSYATGLSILEHSLAWFNAPTAVDNNVEPGVITDYSLSQNYPNPFNPETKISFSIAKAGNVSLAVYNVVGQKVANLVNGQKAAGKYQITWNANDLGSGVYFYRLEVGDFSRTMKMMLLR